MRTQYKHLHTFREQPCDIWEAACKLEPVLGRKHSACAHGKTKEEAKKNLQKLLKDHPNLLS